ncbi:pilin [Uliginosibacterium sp. H1]|uniref:pilin n=1 Tax=Uliginosibacterium sp. H1 TaxID=3114757 RepID=UPI002E197708|nr:pilin [Uliginosibacterium sp. H1]
MTSRHSGFTLIELMIVVAVIGILAAIALPAYQGYAAKSQATSAFATLSALKTVTEDIYTSGGVPADIGQLGITASASNLGTVAGTFGADGQASLTFTFDGEAVALLSGRIHTLARTDQGQWSCTSTVDAQYKPRAC